MNNRARILITLAVFVAIVLGLYGWMRWDSRRPLDRQPIWDAQRHVDEAVTDGERILATRELDRVILEMKDTLERKALEKGLLKLAGLLLSTPSERGNAGKASKPLSLEVTRASIDNAPHATDGKTSGDIIAQQNDDAAAIEDRIRELIAPIFGDRLKEVDASGVVHAGVRVSFLAGADGRSGVTETRLEMRNAYQEIFTNVNISDVTLAAYAVVMDALGNETTQIVYETHMNKQVAGMINWKNKDRLDFTKLWKTQMQDARWMRK